MRICVANRERYESGTFESAWVTLPMDESQLLNAIRDVLVIDERTSVLEFQKILAHYIPEDSEDIKVPFQINLNSSIFEINEALMKFNRELIAKRRFYNDLLYKWHSMWMQYHELAMEMLSQKNTCEAEERCYHHFKKYEHHKFKMFHYQ